MTGGTLALLLVVWAVVLVPGLVRDWRRSPVASADSFAESMRRLGGSRERRYVVVPGSAQRRVVHPPGVVTTRQVRRRRGVLLRLAVGAAASLLLALAVSSPATWTLAGLMGTTTIAYVVLLRLRTVRAARTRQVVPLHPARSAPAGGAAPDAASGRIAGPTLDEGEPVAGDGAAVHDAVVGH